MSARILCYLRFHSWIYQEVGPSRLCVHCYAHETYVRSGAWKRTEWKQFFPAGSLKGGKFMPINNLEATND